MLVGQFTLRFYLLLLLASQANARLASYLQLSSTNSGFPLLQANVRYFYIIVESVYTVFGSRLEYAMDIVVM